MNEAASCAPSFPAVILAAGEGRRVGQPKALIDLSGQPLIRWVARECDEAGFRPLVGVVPPALQEEVSIRCPELSGVLVNPQPETGPLGSLHIAMESLPDDAQGLLFVLADFALVQSTTYQAIAKAVFEDPTRLWRPVREGRHGHPVWFPRSVFSALRDAPMEKGAREVVYARQDLWGAVETDDLWIHRDLDTPEDLDVFRSESKRLK